MADLDINQRVAITAHAAAVEYQRIFGGHLDVSGMRQAIGGNAARLSLDDIDRKRDDADISEGQFEALDTLITNGL